MARYYVEKDGGWNIFSTVVDDFLFDEFICLDALKARLLYERFKELTEDIDSLLTDNPRVNVMTYSEAIERKQADTPQTEMDKCYKCKWWNYSYGCSNKKGICDFEQADTPQTNLVEDSPSLVKDLVKDLVEDYEPYEYEIKAWHKEHQEPYCEIADTPQTECDTCRHYKPACELFSEICKYEPTTQTETENSNLTFEKVMEEIQTQVIEFPDTHQKFTFARKIEMDGDSIKIGGWEYKGVKDAERFVKGSEQTERSE